MTKILILNQCSIAKGYDEIDRLSRNTWAKTYSKYVDVYHYYGAFDSENNPISTLGELPERGNARVNKIDSDNILVCGANDTPTYKDDVLVDPRAEKLILAYEYCLNNLNFDFVVRICNTTYLDIKKLHRVLDGLTRKERVYDGARNLYNYEYPFCGGFSNYMSRDCVEQLVSHKNDYLSLPRNLLIEDLAVGVILMHKTKYAYWDEPHLITHVNAYEPTYDITSYNPNDNIFSYRFRANTLEKYRLLHQIVQEKQI